jgi:hypothetical protein
MPRLGAARETDYSLQLLVGAEIVSLEEVSGLEQEVAELAKFSDAALLRRSEMTRSPDACGSCLSRFSFSTFRFSFCFRRFSFFVSRFSFWSAPMTGHPV